MNPIREHFNSLQLSPRQETNRTNHSIFTNCGCAAIAAIGAAFAYIYPSQLPGFIVGAALGLSITCIANRRFAENPAAAVIRENDNATPRHQVSKDSNITNNQKVPIPLDKVSISLDKVLFGPNISSKYADSLREACVDLMEKKLPPANYCFDLWGSSRKEINAKSLLEDLRTQAGFNPALPVFLIVLRSSTKDTVESSNYSQEQLDRFAEEGLHGIAFFNAFKGGILSGSGFDENQLKIQQAYSKWQESNP